MNEILRILPVVNSAVRSFLEDPIINLVAIVSWIVFCITLIPIVLIVGKPKPPAGTP